MIEVKKLFLLGAMMCMVLCVSAQNDGVDKKQLKAEEARIDSIHGVEARVSIANNVWMFSAEKMTVIKESASASLNPVLKQGNKPDLMTQVSCFIQQANNAYMQTDYFARENEDYDYMTDTEYRGTIANPKFKIDKKGKVVYTFDMVQESGAVIACDLRIGTATNKGELKMDFTEYNFKLVFKGGVVAYQPNAAAEAE